MMAGVVSSYGVDTNWYNDSDATDHITGDLDKLTSRERYTGQEKVHAANGSGMGIKHIGHATVHTHVCPLHLNKVLHVPSATKSLLSVHRFTSDNNVFLEFHPDDFFVKDQASRTTLPRGKSRGGLYPFPSSWAGLSSKQAFSATKPSSMLWHGRLGHPSLDVVRRVVSQNNLPCSPKAVESVCDACMRAKSHQLPFARSVSLSSFPLQLVYSDVWGPAPTSVGRNNYYVSFIDDYIKFVWIFPTFS